MNDLSDLRSFAYIPPKFEISNTDNIIGGHLWMPSY